MIGNLGKKALTDLAVCLSKHVLPKLATKKTASILDEFKRKISGRGAVITGKVFTLFILNAVMDDIIKTAKSLENSALLTDGAAETLKQEIRKQESWFLGAMMTHMVASFITPMASLLIQPVASSLINAISGKRVIRAKNDTRLEYLLYYNYL